MFLPRDLISKVYLHLQSTCHPLSPPVLILVALEPDAVCACRIFTRLLKHDYIPHKIVPVPGYADLERIGKDLVAPMMKTRGGQGGIVVCLGVGGMADLGLVLGLEPEGEAETYGGVEVWVADAHRPWNLGNVFGACPLEPQTERATTFSARTPPGVRGGKIDRTYRPGKGGIIVLDDGDIEEDLGKEKEAFLALTDMPEIDDDGEDLGDSEDESEDEEDGDEPVHAGTKRKSWSIDDEDSDEDDRPRQRRRSNSVGLTDLVNSEALLTFLSPVRSRILPDDQRNVGLYRSVTTPPFSPMTDLTLHLQHNPQEGHPPEPSGGDCCGSNAKRRMFCRTTTEWEPHTRSRFPR